MFYFGNAIGEVGDDSTRAVVNASDEIAARNNPKTFVSPATIRDHHDFNRDGFVNAADQIIARSNATPIGGELRLITVPAALSGMLNQSHSVVDSILADSAAFAFELDRSRSSSNLVVSRAL